MVDIERTELPGVGIRFDFITSTGHRVGVISHRTGKRELFICDRDDPDSPTGTVKLDGPESRALAEVLGGSRVVDDLFDLQHEVEGLSIDWIKVPEGSPYDGRTIADTAARTRTGVSFVAILREGRATPAPTPDVRIAAGDTLLVVGTPEGIKQVVALLASG
jgi:TrkA domain protein